MPTYGSLWPTYATQWDHMQINPNKVAEFKSIAQRLVASKERYQAVEKKTGVPWYMIALIHERESSQSWKASLAQGDPWNKVSIHVPRGRGPFNSWEEAAIDALHIDKLDQVKDWRLEKILYYLELYNGWGYNAHSVPSAYVWAGSSVYTRGKYIADGVWSSSAVDTQPGCAPLLKTMQQLDPTIKPLREEGAKKPSVTAPVIVGTGAGAAVWHWWDSIAAHPKTSVAIAVGVVLVGAIIYDLIKGTKQDVQ